jgi:TM2 domain-containing membrane protein YozV
MEEPRTPKHKVEQPASVPDAAPATHNQLAGPTQVAAPDENPNKEYLVALLISYLVGHFGGDRFYLGKIKSGIVKLITFGGFGIWTIIDLLLLAFGKLTEKDDDRMLAGYAKNQSWVKLVAIILVVFNTLIILAMIPLFIWSMAADEKGGKVYDTRPESYPSRNFTDESTVR